MLEHRGLCSPSQAFPFGSDETFILIPKTCYFNVDSITRFCVHSVRLTNKVFVGLFPPSPWYLFVLMSDKFGVVLQCVQTFYATAVSQKQKLPEDSRGNNNSP